ncbi:hypothetical protein [Rhodocaloribacter sp.]
MDFEEMKVIWDTQEERPMYALNEAALHENIRKSAGHFKRLVVFFETVLMGVAVGLSVFYVIDPLLHGQNYDRLVSAAILAGAAVYFFFGIRRRWQHETEFDLSLLGDLNKALWQIEHHIARSRAIRWSFIVPFSLAAVIDFAFPLHDHKPVWLILLFLLLMAVSAWGVEYEIRCFYLPKKRKLESLRDLLVSPGDPSEETAA